MTNLLYNTLLNMEMILSLIIFVLLLFITAPYGRFGRKGWGPSISSRLAWIVMESPSVIMPMVYLYKSNFSPVSLIFSLIWLSHYFHRTVVYPFRISDPGKPFYIIILLWGFLFNGMNSFINFHFLFYIKPFTEVHWLLSWHFICGAVLFITGFVINKKSDAILRKLRKKNSESYSIPEGWLYRWISSPNYLGEIVLWGGWALLTWSPAGLAFFLFTIANLAPRAIKIHQWYIKRFENYPEDRKALIPFIL